MGLQVLDVFVFFFLWGRGGVCFECSLLHHFVGFFPLQLGN